MHMDVLIFGGGSAGLWLLDNLTQTGYSTLLLEAGHLGQGQTISSQGIIHGGLKYTLTGLLTASANNIKEMPGIWRRCLMGQSYPQLTRTEVKSEYCYLWRTESISSQIGMISAKFGLRVTPKSLKPDQRPAILADCPGDVAWLEEQVIDAHSFLADLANQHYDQIYQIDANKGLRFDCYSPGKVSAVHLRTPGAGGTWELKPKVIVFTAGAGNAGLRQKVGLSSETMQKRPLHVVMVRGALPQLNGHCVDGSKTRVTITSGEDKSGRTVWQLGGQVSESSMKLKPDRLIRHAYKELQAVLPDINLNNTEWATYRVDRAEGKTNSGLRPDAPTIDQEGNVITGWPTKLALAPILSQEIMQQIRPLCEPSHHKISNEHTTALQHWPRPSVALLPWNRDIAWHAIEGQPTPKAA